jgi:hypothetical protein
MIFSKKSLLALCLLFGLTIVLAACGGGGDNAEEGNNNEGAENNASENNEGSDGAAEIEEQKWSCSDGDCITRLYRNNG